MIGDDDDPRDYPLDRDLGPDMRRLAFALEYPDRVVDRVVEPAHRSQPWRDRIACLQQAQLHAIDGRAATDPRVKAYHEREARRWLDRAGETTEHAPSCPAGDPTDSRIVCTCTRGEK